MARLTSTDLEELERLCPGGVVRHVNLAEISQWRIGGMADVLLRPSSTAEVSALRAWFYVRGIRPAIIGSTSNLLFSDDGLHVPALQLSNRLGAVTISNFEVLAQAGIWVPCFARKLMQAGLSGAEHICGIPGTLGGLICMNGGSQRKGIGSSVVEVESVAADGAIARRSAKQCEFAYRRSIFQHVNELVTAVKLRFEERPTAEMRREMISILTARSRKFPRKLPNCGSVFVSDPMMHAEHGPPGAIIEKLGFKGHARGGALVSPHHANFIVNTGDATCSDVLALISEISSAAQRYLGAPLTAEVRYVAPDGASYPATDIPEWVLGVPHERAD